MPDRYLFGPVTAEFAEQNLSGPRRTGSCLSFGTEPGLDVTVAPNDTWESVCNRLPGGWRPDIITLWLPYTDIPDWVCTAPIPVVGLAADWNLLWHHYRICLPRCDLVFTDEPGVEALTRSGLTHVRPANLFGLGRDYFGDGEPDLVRDIDILFVGNLHSAVQGERLPWLARLARLADRFNVVIRTGVFGADYRSLLRRARIVFNHSIRGECNRRAFEAPACGALLFQEAGNREVPRYLADRLECVCYDEANLEVLLEYYLDHEIERRAIAEAGQLRARQWTFERLWGDALSILEAERDALTDRARRRTAPPARAALLGRVSQAYVADSTADPSLVGDLTKAIAAAPGDAALHHALGLATALGDTSSARLDRAAAAFGRAADLDLGHAVAGLSRAEALIALGRDADAAKAARRGLDALELVTALSGNALDAPRFPATFDAFRVAWERAGWETAGRPGAEAAGKRGLVRWRLHTLLAGLTGDLAHYHEAALARPSEASSRAALGCALARAGRKIETLPHLRLAVATQPFDRAATRALAQVLTDLGDEAEHRRLARDMRRLAKAAPQALPLEPWFTDPPPVGDELASILVACCDGLAFTRECLDSVVANTRPPYELVVVDNGSTDGTADYLMELKARPGPDRVVIIRNIRNRGYPAAANQALAAARGDYLVFLNNDAVVPPGWLDGLVAWVVRTWPRAGLVGPVTNYAPPPQLVGAPYATPAAGLAAFAADRRRTCAGRALDVPRLSGFCLLGRRDVLARVGGLDERYGPGFFDDDDLGLRVREAGFLLLLAEDVFVHHYGSQTFAALGVDCDKLLAGNLELFRSKWGAERAAGYRPLALTPDPTVTPPPAASSTGRPRVTLCMIVKDEAENLPDCLRGLDKLFDEIVVADTGSTDRTKVIATEFGARVVDFPWCDSFAAARNASLDAATGDWVMWLDADDRLDVGARNKLKDLFERLDDDAAGYVMKCACVGGAQQSSPTVVDHVRLFRRAPGLRWTYRVHEQILPAIRKTGGQVRWADVTIRHVGYVDPALRRRKLDRDIRLLGLEDAERPDDPFTLFNLGSVHQELGRPTEALPLLRRSLERSSPADSIVRKLYALIVGCHRRLGQPSEALTICREGRQHYADDTELLFLEGILHRERGDVTAAEACWLRLLDQREENHFASVDGGLRGPKARHNLAVLYLEGRRYAEAEAQWRSALTADPDYLPALFGLGELYLTRHRWTELAELIRKLEGEAGGQVPVEAAVLRARSCIERKEFAAARWAVTEAIHQHPQAVQPRIVLSHVLLKEGKDWAAAEQALLDVLALAPGHSEAVRNLSLLRERRAAGVA
jgi:glycosyltransferase involved in cell wall biosynthesis/tetratricopeptide (TPR) repeat protein